MIHEFNDKLEQIIKKIDECSEQENIDPNSL